MGPCPAPPGTVSTSIDTLSAGAHTLTLTVTDAQGDACTDQQGVQVDSPPVVGTVVVTPELARVGETLTCTATASDAEDGTPSLSYTWTDGSTGSTYTVPDTGDPGDTLTCTATATDSAGSTDVGTATATVENSPPELTSVSISPSPAVSDDTLTCTAVATDADADTPGLTFLWTNDTTGDTLASSSTVTLSSATASPGDTLSCAVTATDPHGGEATDTATVSIDNRTPSAPGVAITPATPVANQDDLLCAVSTASTDPDDDPVSYTVAWSKDGTAWTGASASTTLTGDTISVTDTLEGEVWTCTITPTDGTDAGTAGTGSVTIDAPEPPWSATVSMADADLIIVGEAYRDPGRPQPLGDVDGDGLADLAIGASLADRGAANAGTLYIFLGSSLASGVVDIDDADIIIDGSLSSNAIAGWSDGGDLDGDGRTDVLIDAYRDPTGGTEAGALYVFYGSSLVSGTAMDVEDADLELQGPAGSRFGVHVASGGDYDSDGIDDVAVGASYYSGTVGTDEGRVYVFSGADLAATTASTALATSLADTVITSGGADDRLGQMVSWVGDVDGDGADDLAASAYQHDGNATDSGATWLFLGSSLGTGSISVAAADAEFLGTGASDWMNTIGDRCDLDGDTYSDVVLTAFLNDDNGTDAGALYVFHGATLTTTGVSHDADDADLLVWGQTGEQLGSDVSCADLDGDGLDDLVASAPAADGDETDAGRAYLFLGASVAAETLLDSTDADVTFLGEHTDDYAGYPVILPGDLDGDGAPDLVLGAHLGDDTAGTTSSDVGRTYVFFGD